MARTSPPVVPAETVALSVHTACCPHCGGFMRRDYNNHRIVRGLGGAVRLDLLVRRCKNPQCPRFHVPFRPEEEGGWALPDQEFGLDVVALVGMLRHRERRSVPEIHARLREQHSMDICERTVTNLLNCYEELVATRLADSSRLRALLASQGRAILAIDGLAPAAGHEVLWVVRECISGQVLLARTMLSAAAPDLARLLAEVAGSIGVPVLAVLSDGQLSIRRAAEKALPGVPHQLCQFHYLREASRLIFEADRHARKELRKRVRGVRKIEREAPQEGPMAPVVEEYAAAVRAALDDDGQAPLDAPGVRLRERLGKISASLEKAGEKGGPANPLSA